MSTTTTTWWDYAFSSLTVWVLAFIVGGTSLLTSTQPRGRGVEVDSDDAEEDEDHTRRRHTDAATPSKERAVGEVVRRWANAAPGETPLGDANGAR